MPEPVAIRAGLVPLEHDLVATFQTRRGTFDVPRELFDDGREYDLSVYLAQRLPPLCTTVSKSITRDGVTITWRKIGVHIDPA